jgi:hypothetical protein
MRRFLLYLGLMGMRKEGRDAVAELAVGRSRYLGMAGEKLARDFRVA